MLDILPDWKFLITYHLAICVSIIIVTLKVCMIFQHIYTLSEHNPLHASSKDYDAASCALYFSFFVSITIRTNLPL